MPLHWKTALAVKIRMSSSKNRIIDSEFWLLVLSSDWLKHSPEFYIDILDWPIFANLSLSLFAAAAAAKLLQSCPTLCDPIDGSPPGPSVHGIFQARVLEWVVISFSNVWKWKVKVKSLSCVWPLETPLTAVHQAPLSMGFSRQEYWSGVPSPSPLSLFK